MKSQLKRKKVFFLINCIIILIINTNCEKKKTDNVLSIVDIAANVHNMQKILLSQFTDNVRYVPLESNLDHPISGIAISDFSEKYILVSDYRICLLYENNGHLIRQIGIQGRGPGEHMGISSIFIINEKIYLHDYVTNDLIEYLSDGTFLERYKNGYDAGAKNHLAYKETIMINDSMIFGNIQNESGHNEYKALIIDKYGKIKYYYKNFVFFELGPGVYGTKAPRFGIKYKFKDKIHFKEFYSDTLFRMDDQYRLLTDYVFNIGKYKEPFSKRGMDWTQKGMSSYIYLDRLYETDDFLFLICDFNKYFPAKRLSPVTIRMPGVKDYTQWYNYTGQGLIGVYNKKAHSLIFSEPTRTNDQLSSSGLYNDFDGGPRFYPDKMVNDSTMVMIIRFDYLKEYILSDDFKNIIPIYPEKKRDLKYSLIV